MYFFLLNNEKSFIVFMQKWKGKKPTYIKYILVVYVYIYT